MEGLEGRLLETGGLSGVIGLGISAVCVCSRNTIGLMEVSEGWCRSSGGGGGRGGELELPFKFCEAWEDTQ